MKGGNGASNGRGITQFAEGEPKRRMWEKQIAAAENLLGSRIKSAMHNINLFYLFHFLKIFHFFSKIFPFTAFRLPNWVYNVINVKKRYSILRPGVPLQKSFK